MELILEEASRLDPNDVDNFLRQKLHEAAGDAAPPLPPEIVAPPTKLKSVEIGLRVHVVPLRESGTVIRFLPLNVRTKGRPVCVRLDSNKEVWVECDDLDTRPGIETSFL